MSSCQERQITVSIIQSRLVNSKMGLNWFNFYFYRSRDAYLGLYNYTFHLCGFIWTKCKTSAVLKIFINHIFKEQKLKNMINKTYNVKIKSIDIINQPFMYYILT